MKIHSHLKKSRHGIYYLRLQINGLDRRWSLHTRDPNLALIESHKLGVTIQEMKINQINLSKAKGWTLESDGQNIKVTTENNDADRKSATEALVALVQAQSLKSQQAISKPEPTQFTISVSHALIEYTTYINKTNTVEKSQKMAISAINNLEKLLGPDFNMAELTDEVIEERWMQQRLKEVAQTTVKRDLSFIRSFISWGVDKKRKYCMAKLTITMDAKGGNWSYLDRTDLVKIFSNLPQYAIKPYQLWVPLLGLYTGARISELAGLKVSSIYEKSNIDAMHLSGTKTDASDRHIPIHPDLIKLGFLEFVETRRLKNKDQLFDISKAEGGKLVSKWYTSYKKKIGLNDKYKVFHSFRPTLVDHIKQAGCDFEARCQYVGHDAGGGVHNKIYGRNQLSLRAVKETVVDKIDWKAYCDFSLDFETLKAAGAALTRAK